MVNSSSSVFGGNPIRCNVPLDKDGLHRGMLELIDAGPEYNYGVIPIPIIVMKNGIGPTVFLSSGCHGDEYEGMLVLRDLMQNLRLEDISGRLIILPSLNYPAVMAGTRTSPLDRGNLNRSFPGRPDGGPTEAIAHFICHELFPICDAGIDLHSGGRDLEFLPSAFVCTTPNQKIFDATLEMSKCFETSYVTVCDCGSPPTGIDGAAHDLGIPFISAELGGGGVSATKVVETGINSVLNLLDHLGVLKNHLNSRERVPHQYLNMISECDHIIADKDGIFRTFVDVGDHVEAGQLLARLYPLNEMDAKPTDVLSPGAGVIVTRRAVNRAIKGNYIFMVAKAMGLEEIKQVVAAGFSP